VATKIKNTTLRECVVIAITNTEGLKNLGTVIMKSFTLTECAKIAISILITEREENKSLRKKMIKSSAKAH